MLVSSSEWEKANFELFHINFRTVFFLKEVLGLLVNEETNFMLNKKRSCECDCLELKEFYFYFPFL